MTTRSPWLAALLATGLLASGCSALGAGDDDSSSPLVSTRCADLVVLGARGSTQAPDRNLGVGKEVRVSVQALARRLGARSGTTVRIEPVRYDASASRTTDVFEEHAAAGARQMGRRLAGLTSACPDSRFALVGFSQGAEVVHTLASDMSARQAERVDLVAMIADPRHSTHDAITQWSYAAQPTSYDGRLGAGVPIDADLRDVAISLCVAGDDICDARPGSGGAISPTHEAFYEQPATARATAEQLDKVLTRTSS